MFVLVPPSDIDKVTNVTLAQYFRTYSRVFSGAKDPGGTTREAMAQKSEKFIHSCINITAHFNLYSLSVF